MSLHKFLNFFRRKRNEATAVIENGAMQDFTKAKKALMAHTGEDRSGTLARLVGHALPEEGTPKDVAEKLRVLEIALSIRHDRGFQKIKQNFDVNGPIRSRILGAFSATHREWNDDIHALMDLQKNMLDHLSGHLDVATLLQIQAALGPKRGK